MYVGLDWLIVISMLLQFFLIELLIYLLKSDFENVWEHYLILLQNGKVCKRGLVGCFITTDFFFLSSLITLIITN